MSKTDLGVALVTGASSGIGRATAQALRRAGYRLFGTSRRATPLEGGRVRYESCAPISPRIRFRQELAEAQPSAGLMSTSIRSRILMHAKSHLRRLDEKCASR